MESIALGSGIAHRHPAGGNLALWARLCASAGQWLVRMAEAHASARKTRRTVLELRRLDARMLKDIGLTRADVDLLAGSVPGPRHNDADWDRCF